LQNKVVNFGMRWCGRFEEISVKYFNNQVFDYGLSRMCYPILSDNLPFLRGFADLKYKKDDKGFQTWKCRY
jgi:hypothetical protein